MARPPSRAMEPVATEPAPPVATVVGELEVLEPEPEPEPLAVVVRVTLVGPPVAVVERLPAGADEATEVTVLESGALEEGDDTRVLEATEDELDLEMVRVAVPLAEDDELDTALPPVMWKGNEYS